eukprot:1166088-Prymnesium_polylepis.1
MKFSQSPQPAGASALGQDLKRSLAALQLLGALGRYLSLNSDRCPFVCAALSVQHAVAWFVRQWMLVCHVIIGSCDAGGR